MAAKSAPKPAPKPAAKAQGPKAVLVKPQPPSKSAAKPISLPAKKSPTPATKATSAKPQTASKTAAKTVAKAKAAAPKPAAKSLVPTRPVTTTTVNQNTVQPFLTAQQQQALNNWDTKYGYTLAADQRKITDAQANTTQKLQTAGETAAQQSDTTNQAMGARGMFQSSIRAGALSDIAAHLTMSQNILNTNLQKIVADTNSSINQLGTQNADTQQQYHQYAVTNAMNQTPAQPTNTTTTQQVAYTPTPPANAPAGAIWRGPSNPGAGYKGIGGGWWAPMSQMPAAQHAATQGVSHAGATHSVAPVKAPAGPKAVAIQKQPQSQTGGGVGSPGKTGGAGIAAPKGAGK